MLVATPNFIHQFLYRQSTHKIQKLNLLLIFQLKFKCNLCTYKLHQQSNIICYHGCTNDVIATLVNQLHYTHGPNECTCVMVAEVILLLLQEEKEKIRCIIMSQDDFGTLEQMIKVNGIDINAELWVRVAHRVWVSNIKS